jgi:tetratricopeptide (TPR) repeat protein
LTHSDDSARWRVFISHTSELRDFPRGASYVAAAERAITAAGHVIVDMADFPAADQAPGQLCIDRVRGCDVYLGVLGTRYGSPVRDRPEVSYTELEFETATEAGLDRLVFLLDADADVGIPPNQLIDREYGSRQDAFRRRVQGGGLVTQSFGNPVALGQCVERSLRGLADERRQRSKAQVDVSPLVPAAPDVQISLPTDAAAFTGRDEELDTITTALTGAAKAGGVIEIAAIDGMPGVGKTALAVHAAHILRDSFPDLPPLFVDLHGYTPGQEPIPPEVALARLLSAIGVDPRHLPDNMDDRKKMWQRRMAGRRALLVMDNAVSSGQIIPLLPGGGDCLVLVTSRRYLGDLPGAVTRLLLDALPAQQAEEMFIQLAPRAADSPGEVAEIVHLAGYLPLAISLLARVFNRHLSWTLANLASETREKVLTLKAEYANVAAAFDISYQSLDPAFQRLFRLLGLHPGSTADDYAAAALAATSPTEAADLLDGLHREGLITEVSYHRYGMHDLLRRYASDLAAREAADSEEALGRLLDYYEHTAACAEARLACQPEPVTPPAAPALDDIGQALEWVRADRLNLLACLDYVTRTGQDARVMALTAALATDFQREGPWPDAIARNKAAIQAALRVGDRPGEANALNHLGFVQRLTGDYSDAAQAHEQALRIYRSLGDRSGEARALTSLGTVRRQKGNYQDAIRSYEQALSIHRDLGERIGEAHTLHYLGVAWWQTSKFRNAMNALEQAIAIYRDLGDLLSEPHALNHLGIARRLTGDYPGAARVHEEALGICRDLKDRLAEADVCVDFGIVRRMTGDFADATEYLEQASHLFQDLGDARGGANADNNLGIVWRLTGDPHGAIRVHNEALTVFRELGDRRGEAFALTYLCAALRVASEYLAAFQAIEQALVIYRDIGNRDGEAEALNEIGALYLIRGDLAQAEASHQQARELARAVVSPWNEAHALAGLGRCALARGDIAEAENLLRQAYAILQRIGAADANAILAELTDLTGTGQGNTG